MKNIVDGKYYDPSIDPMDAINDYQNQEEIWNIEKKFNDRLSELYEEIQSVEDMLESSSDINEQLRLKKYLQPLYEKKSYADYFLYKDYFARAWMLEKAYNDGAFLLKHEAEQLINAMDVNALVNSPEHKQKEEFCERLLVVSSISFPLSTLVIGAFIIENYDPLLYLYLWPFVICPFSILVGMVIFPRIIRKIVLKDKVSEKMDKELKKTSSYGIASIVAMIIGSLFHSKKNKQ